ncbi:MAG TPA: AlkA N-terminal domain-containing protein [Actinomycetota bacterium]|nr:AlkA N-terminal domain-containing protein [Actinomycetota bacterium]
MFQDFERCYRAVQSRDERFDGVFVTAVTSTGIYCRPSCPALTPKRANVRFLPTAAAAQAAGFRACKRCRPDASPGSPEWSIRADIAGRAMRLIGDGIVDREGVAGLASRLHVGERHLHRLLLGELGAGPQALARARRAETARILIETLDISFTDAAFAAGFSSIRQFNDTIRAVFASTPTELRRKRAEPTNGHNGSLTLRLPYRKPFDGARLLAFLGSRAVPGVEEFAGGVYRRTLTLPRGAGIVELDGGEDYVRCILHLADLRDLGPAVQRCRRLLDLDADPLAVSRSLSRDAVLRAHGRWIPGLRIPGTVDGAEIAFRAVLGQQVSVAAARTLAGRLVALAGTPLDQSEGNLTHSFPSPEAVAEADLSELGLPLKRRETLRAVASAIAEGRVNVDAGADRVELQRTMQEIPGVGPWTAAYVSMRLGDPDVFLATDLGVRKALEKAAVDSAPKAAQTLAHRWRPWRSYALLHLWTDQTKKEDRDGKGGTNGRALSDNHRQSDRNPGAGGGRNRAAAPALSR